MKVEYLQFDSKRRFGIEIEMNRSRTTMGLKQVVDESLGGSHTDISGWGYTCNNPFWVIKPDSSCGDLGCKSKDGGGYEVASAVGMGCKHLADIEAVTDGLKKSGAKVNEHCGFHCQVEIKDFALAQAATMLAYWCKIEDLLTHTVPGHRVGSKHCKSFRDKRDRWRVANQCKTASDFWSVMRLSKLGASAKRNSLTLVNYQRTRSTSYEWEYFNRPTVELRMPESSLESYDTKNWARLFINFVEWSHKRPFPTDLGRTKTLKDLLVILGLKDPNNFTILSPGLFETKCWLLFRLNKYSRTIPLRAAVLEEWCSTMSSDMKYKYKFPQVITKPLPKKEEGCRLGRKKPTMTISTSYHDYARY